MHSEQKYLLSHTHLTNASASLCEHLFSLVKVPLEASDFLFWGRKKKREWSQDPSKLRRYGCVPSAPVLNRTTEGAAEGEEDRMVGDSEKNLKVLC